MANHERSNSGTAPGGGRPSGADEFTNEKKDAAKQNDIEMNSQLKKKMNGIRVEVANFNKNIDEFSLICDNELAKLYDNVEKVSTNIGETIEEKQKQKEDHWVLDDQGEIVKHVPIVE